MLCGTSKRIDVWGSARNMIGGLIGVLGWLLRFARLMLVPKAVLAADLPAAESQLVACTDATERKKAPKPRFTLSFRLLWIALSKWLPGWRKLAHVMQPATVVGWHRRMAKFLWRWKSRPGRPSGTWLPFLRNHLDVAWAMDFFTVKTLTFRTLFVFVIIEHGRRKVRHWATTYNPTMQWVIQQLRNAMPFGEQPRFMHRDNDGLCGASGEGRRVQWE